MSTENKNGLFSKVIRNMKENRTNHRMAPSHVVPKKPYKFYYNEFREKQN